MSLQAILDAIQAAGDVQVRAIEADARDRAQDILCKARTESQRLREVARQNALAPALEDGARIRQQAQFEARRTVSGEQEALIDSILERSRESLAGIRADPVYPSVLRRLIMEALTDLRQSLAPGEGICLEADPRDCAVLERLLSEIDPELPVSYPLNCCGGVVASSSDGRIIAINTLEARLERAIPSLRHYLHQMLLSEAAMPDLALRADAGA